MVLSWSFFLPLLAAFGYVAAALSLKRASDLGAGLWHSAFVSNVLAGILFQGLLLLGGPGQPIEMWWQPLFLALLFLVGQILSLLSLQKGDVSIATPVLGLKILLVALFTTLLIEQKLGWPLWMAAILSTCGIAALNNSGAHRVGARATATILSAGGAAVCYALCDVLLQKWSPAWGAGRLLPMVAAIMGGLSLGLVRLFPTPLLALGRPALAWLVGGGIIFAAQSMLFATVVATFGQATASNVIYSSRGLWSVAAVALLGGWFASTETTLGPSILRWRLAGAALMFAAVLLVLLPST
jgi:drug/metabolite transporter (DMT)-like permease